MATATKTDDQAPPEDTQDQVASDEPKGPETFKNADGVEFTIRHDDEADPNDGQLPHLLEGERVEILKGPGTVVDGQDGARTRMAYVIALNYENELEELKAANPAHAGRRFAKVATYDVRTRDARSEVLTVKPDDIRTLSTENGWGRGSI